MSEQFEKDVIEGLSASPKRLPSRYFYDETGDRLFQQIMALDEYYLTRAEYAVLEKNAAAILQQIDTSRAFSLVEFGAGDGRKTRLLLDHFLHEKVEFTYRPIDISVNALNQLTTQLAADMPGLKVEGIPQEYFSALRSLDSGGNPKVVLFLGSNIGNFTDDRALSFLNQLYASMSPGDMVLIGFDLKKDPASILKAYSDSEGITAAFNLNLLDRINRDLGSNFQRNDFRHYATYDPLSGQARSFLISLTDQRVTVGERDFMIRRWEPIHTEISRKFDPQETDAMARTVGFQVADQYFDDTRRFMDALWVK